MGKTSTKAAAAAAAPTAPATALPDAQTLADLLNLPLADILRRIELLQSRNPGVPITVDQVATLLRSQVTPNNMLAMFTNGGRLLLEAFQKGRSEVRRDPSALA